MYLTGFGHGASFAAQLSGLGTFQGYTLYL